jgi:hypothetical protein
MAYLVDTSILARLANTADPFHRVAAPGEWTAANTSPWRKRMATTKRRYSKEEFARRGDAIYDKKVGPQLKAGDAGKFAAIDIETGEFAVDADELRACRKLRKRIPDAQIWMVRVGSPYVHRIGGREQQEVP